MSECCLDTGEADSRIIQELKAERDALKLAIAEAQTKKLQERNLQLTRELEEISELSIRKKIRKILTERKEKELEESQPLIASKPKAVFYSRGIVASEIVMEYEEEDLAESLINRAVEFVIKSGGSR